MKASSLARLAGLFFLSIGSVAAQESDLAGGKEIAEERCARCHAIGRNDESRMRQAPAFRSLHRRYPVEHLAEALAEGIEVGHEAMPEIVLEPQEIDRLIIYLKSLETVE